MVKYKVWRKETSNSIPLSNISYFEKQNRVLTSNIYSVNKISQRDTKHTEEKHGHLRHVQFA